VLVGADVFVCVGARVGAVVLVARIGVAGGSVAGVTGVAVDVDIDVAVAFGEALLQAESSRTRIRKVSFFIISIVQTKSLLVNPPFFLLIY